MDPFIGEIVMFGGNFNPRGWAKCDGQLLPIDQNSALFSILGTLYGGDGRTTFGLPDLRGRVPIHTGTGPGLSPRALGRKGGGETATISENQLPAHDHALQGSTDQATEADPSASGGNKVPAQAELNIYTESAPDVAMAANAIGAAGGGQPHTNVMPFQVVCFIIALVGVFPSRN